MGNICGLRICQASAWAEVATFLIKRKWPKIDQGGPWTPLRRQAVQGGSGLARHWFHGRFQASALPLVGPWAVLQSVRLLEGPGSLGGRGPAATDVSSVARKESLCAAQLGIQEAFSHTLPRGETSAQIPPRTAGGLGRGSPRWLAICSTSLRKLIPPSLAQRHRENAPYPGTSGGPDSAANSGRAGPTSPAGRLSPCTGARGAPRPLFVTFSRQRK